MYVLESKFEYTILSISSLLVQSRVTFTACGLAIYMLIAAPSYMHAPVCLLTTKIVLSDAASKQYFHTSEILLEVSVSMCMARTITKKGTELPLSQNRPV